MIPEVLTTFPKWASGVVAVVTRNIEASDGVANQSTGTIQDLKDRHLHLHDEPTRILESLTTGLLALIPLHPVPLQHTALPPGTPHTCTCSQDGHPEAPSAPSHTPSLAPSGALLMALPDTNLFSSILG